MKKKILSIVICCVILVSLLPQTQLFAFAATSGTCGDNLTWTLDDEGTLTISGEGEMWDYWVDPQWKTYYDKIDRIVLESGVTTIGWNAFAGETYLHSLVIPDTLNYISGNVFSGGITTSPVIENLYIEDLEAWCKIEFESSPMHFVNNVYIDGKLMTEIIVPSGITTIKQFCFTYCNAIKSVFLPDGVIDIENNAFLLCENMENINLPDTVTNIGRQAFSSCKSLTQISIPEGITTLGEGIFSNCISLEKITIPNTVTNVGNGSFRDCISLCEIKLPEKIKEISGSAFYNCQSLQNIDLPINSTIIGSYAFYNCTSLENILIPEKVTSIGEYAFSGCSKLKNITIPSGCESLEFYTFQNCINLRSVTLSNGVTTIKNFVFDGCDNLMSVTIPESVTTIGSSAFLDCPNLTIYGYANSYAETYATENSIPFVALSNEEAEPISYSYGQTVQIGLIEPWFLKANARVYTGENPTNIDYSSLVDYGAYFIRKSELSDANATQETVSVEDIINNTDAVKYSKAAGNATVDGSYITATYDKGLYTYELDDSVFVLFYIQDGAGIQYAPIRERNLKILCEVRMNDTENFTNELERSVYSAMLAMYNATKAYRDDYYANH